jgi:hypothetical protein
MIQGGNGEPLMRSGNHAPVAEHIPTTDDGISSACLHEQWAASLDDIREAAEILEQLFEKFDLDPELANELHAAALQLAEQALAAAEAEPGRPSAKRVPDIN